MTALLYLLIEILDLYLYVVIGAAILSWLLAFGVVNRYNRGVAMIENVLVRLTEPALAPIRRILPDLGGVDVSPVILILLIGFLKNLVAHDLGPILLGY